MIGKYLSNIEACSVALLPQAATRYEENFKNVDELHAKQIQDLEANFQHKMMIEVCLVWQC